MRVLHFQAVSMPPGAEAVFYLGTFAASPGHQEVNVGFTDLPIIKGGASGHLFLITDTYSHDGEFHKGNDADLGPWNSKMTLHT